MAVEIDHHLPRPFRFYDVIHRNRKMTAPAVGNLLALFTRDHHFFDNRSAFFQKPHASGGQNDIPMTAFEQGYRQPLLHLTYRIADGRRYAMQFLRGSAKATISGNSIHNF
ncbi:hypothetical protein D3C80_1096290 [compost metagenome]